MILRRINQKAKSMQKEIKTDNTVEQFLERNSYITINDRTVRFHGQIKCRLINPAKIQIGIVNELT